MASTGNKAKGLRWSTAPQKNNSLVNRLFFGVHIFLMGVFKLTPITTKVDRHELKQIHLSHEYCAKIFLAALLKIHPSGSAHELTW